MINSIITYGSTRITLNDLSNVHSHYRFSLVRPDQVVVRQSKDYIPGNNEVNFFDANLGERVIQLVGVVRGATEADLYQKIIDLKEAFNPISCEDDVSGTGGFLPLKWTDEGQTAKMYLAKPMRLADVTESDNTGWERKFNIYLETENPFAIGQASKSYTLSPDTGSGGTGGAIPATIPMIVAGGSAYYGTAVAVNAGDIAAHCTVTLNNQMSGPKISNETTGEYLQFTTDVAMNDGDSLAIDLKDGTAWLTSGGVVSNVIKYLTASSRFFQIQAGNNTIKLTADSLDSTASATLTFFDTFTG